MGFTNIPLTPELGEEMVIERPKICRHEQCRQPLELINGEWYHIDGGTYCKRTKAEPED
jgi:hypothetical protein